jgi:hypothetical protein
MRVGLRFAVKEGGHAKQVYDSQASISECTLDDLRAADGVRGKK